MYRTAPLAGLWTHQKGGFYPRRTLRHLARRGRITTTRICKLSLSDANKKDLVEYLKGI